MELPVELLEHCFLSVFQADNENWLVDFHAVLMVNKLWNHICISMTSMLPSRVYKIGVRNNRTDIFFQLRESANNKKLKERIITFSSEVGSSSRTKGSDSSSDLLSSNEGLLANSWQRREEGSLWLYRYKNIVASFTSFMTRISKLMKMYDQIKRIIHRFMELEYALISHFHIVQYIVTKDMASLLHALRNMAVDSTWSAREKAVHYYAKKHIYLRFFNTVQDIIREENVYRRLIFGVFEQPQHTSDQDPKLTKIVNQYKYSYNHSYYNPDNPNLQYNHANNTFVNNFNYNTTPNTATHNTDDEERQIPQVTTLMVHSTIFARSLLEARTELLFATYTTELEDNVERGIVCGVSGARYQEA